MNEQIYSDDRARRLVELLRGLGARIAALTSDDELLAAGPELMKTMGDARSELFHFEVRATYDSPQRAESRRIVDEAVSGADTLEFGGGYDPDGDEEDGAPWRG
jgi:hypothetical protein